MTGIFIKILNLSRTATYVAFAVFLFRIIFKKAPKIFSYMLWSVVLFRLICPISFSSSLSLLRPLDKSFDYIPRNIGFIESNSSEINPLGVNIETIDMVVDNTLPEATAHINVNHMHTLMNVFTLIWLLGIAVLVMYCIYSYLKIYRKIRFATLVRENIYETDQIITPFVFGLINPKIYLPIGLKNNELDYIICHEMVHIKRFDYTIKPMSFLVFSIYWFNPVMWICYYLMIKDMEMSCDEMVLKELGSDLKGEYSSSLLSLSVKQSNLILPLAFGESNIKSRIKNILNYKNPKFWTILIALIAVIIISRGLITNPISNQPEKICKEFLRLFYTIENTDIADMIYNSDLYLENGSNIDENGFGIVGSNELEEALTAKYGDIMTEDALNKAISNRTILAGEIPAREFGSKLEPENINLYDEKISDNGNKTYQYNIDAFVKFKDGSEELVNLQGSLMMEKVKGKWKVGDFQPDKAELAKILEFGKSFIYIINRSDASIKTIELNTEGHPSSAINADNSDIDKNVRFDFEMIDSEEIDFTIKLLNKDREVLYERSFIGDFSKGKDMYLYIEEDELGKLMINRGNKEGKYLSSESLNWCIMANGNIYNYTGYEVPVEIDEKDILGKITSIVGEYETLTSNGQANFDIKGSKYAQYKDDIVVLIDNEWVLFKNNENVASGLSISNIGFLYRDYSDEEIFRVFRNIRKYIKVDDNYEANLDTIIEKSFKECGIDDPFTIYAAQSALKITVSESK